MEVEVPTKPWYQSTIIWVNVLMTAFQIVGVIVDSALELHIPPQVLVYITTAQGIITVLLRVFRANLPIGPEGGTRTVSIKQPTDQP